MEHNERQQSTKRMHQTERHFAMVNDNGRASWSPFLDGTRITPQQEATINQTMGIQDAATMSVHRPVVAAG
jgi:hypothetical protein